MQTEELSIDKNDVSVQFAYLIPVNGINIQLINKPSLTDYFRYFSWCTSRRQKFISNSRRFSSIFQLAWIWSKD